MSLISAEITESGFWSALRTIGVDKTGTHYCRHRQFAIYHHRTLGSSACGGCHESQNNWWFGHAHYRSVDPFFASESKNVQIARLYGIDPAEMTTGRHVCMDCHGTVVSGRERTRELDRDT